MVNTEYKKGGSVTDSVMEKVLDGSRTAIKFDKEEVNIINKLAGKENDALKVINDMILSYEDEKGYLMDAFEELLKNDFTGKKLVRLYNEYDKDFERILDDMEMDRLYLLRREEEY